MAENTAIDTVQDDELVDEALDRTSGGKFRACYASAICVG
jgi:hypothetical protein